MASEPASDGTSEPGERRLHPLSLVFVTVAIARALVVPALVGGVSAADGELWRAFTWGLAILALPAIGFATARFLFFRYRIGADELSLRSGVLHRRHRVIPLARVQNIEVRQSTLERLCGVAELHVETAGSGRKAEAVLSVLGRREAEALRDALLARCRAAPPAEGGPVAEPLAHLTPRELVVAGATANEAGVIAAALFGGFQLLEDLPFRLPERFADPRLLIPDLPLLGALLFGLGLLGLLLLLGWGVSVLGALIGYHDFTLERVGDALHKRYGLLARREASVPLSRVQALRVEESLLRRPLGLASLQIATAGGTPGGRQRGGAEAFVPLARVGEVPRLVAGIFAGLDFGSLILQPVHPRSVHRSFARFAFLLALPGVALALAIGPRGLLLLLLVGLALPLARWQFRNRGYALLPGYVVARSGVLNRVTWIVPEQKIQTLQLADSPFQRRHGLASLTVDTAAGGQQATVPDLGREQALELLRTLAGRGVSEPGRE